MDPSSHPSSSTRRRLEAERLRVFDSYGLLETEPSPAIERIIKLASRRLRASTTFIAWVGDGQVTLAPHHGLGPERIERRRGDTGALLTTDLRWYEDLSHDRGPEWLELARHDHLRFFACSPLTTYHGHVLGLLCAGDPRPRAYDESQARELEELAGSLMKQIETRRLYRRLERNKGLFEPRKRHRSRWSQPATRQSSDDRRVTLADRHTLLRRLGRKLERLRHHRRQLRRPSALVVFDLDGFHRLNAEHGYAAGDRVLAELSRRLHSARATHDTATRLSGDRFALLLGELTGTDEAGRRLEALRHRLCEPIALGELSIVPTFCFGICWLDPRQHRFADDILAGAEGCLSRARGLGPGSIAWTDGSYELTTDGGAPAHGGSKHDRPEASGVLSSRTLANEELSLRYRPLETTSDGRRPGLEAHLRWHPQGYRTPRSDSGDRSSSAFS